MSGNERSPLVDQKLDSPYTRPGLAFFSSLMMSTTVSRKDVSLLYPEEDKHQEPVMYGRTRTPHELTSEDVVIVVNVVELDALV